MAQESVPKPAELSPKTKGTKLPLVLGALVVVLAGVGVIGYLQFGPRKPASEAGHPRPVPTEPGVAELEPFVLNLADAAGDRFLKVTVRLVLDQKDIAEKINQEGLAGVKLRDRILSLLATQSANELTTTEGRNELRAEIARVVEPLFESAPFLEQEQDHEGEKARENNSDGAPPAHVLEVFFTEFLVQ